MRLCTVLASPLNLGLQHMWPTWKTLENNCAGDIQLLGALDIDPSYAPWMACEIAGYCARSHFFNFKDSVSISVQPFQSSMKETSDAKGDGFSFCHLSIGDENRLYVNSKEQHISKTVFRDAKAVNSRLSLKQLGHPGQVCNIWKNHSRIMPTLSDQTYDEWFLYVSVRAHVSCAVLAWSTSVWQ